MRALKNDFFKLSLGVMLSVLVGFPLGSQQLAAQELNGTVPYFAGPYVGVYGGFAAGDADTNFLGGGPAFSEDLSDGFIGGQIGYTIQTSNNLVLGLEAAFQTGSREKSANPLGAGTYVTDKEWLGMITARIGFAQGPLLIYFDGGYAFGSIETKFFDTVIPDTSDSMHHGWTIGVGLDYALSDNFLIGMQYNYVDLGSETHGTSFPREVELNDHLIRFHLKWKLGNPKPSFAN